MFRFFIKSSDVSDKYITLSGEDAKHISYSLRMKPGEEIELCDENANVYTCIIKKIDSKNVLVQITDFSRDCSESGKRIVMYQALAKGDKLELVVQKAVELGVSEIHLFTSSRCVVKYDSKNIDTKLKRYNSIAKAAAKQCKRAVVPSVILGESFEQAVCECAKEDMALFLYENEKEHSFKSEIADKCYNSIAFMVGPEGGFSEKEVEIAKKAGMKICTLGKRILRTETVSLFVLSCIEYEQADVTGGRL